MGVDPGGGGMGDMDEGIYPPPPNILGGGMACIIIPPIFHGWMSYHTDKIPTKRMKEMAGFECRNAKIFLARSARSHT